MKEIGYNRANAMEYAKRWEEIQYIWILRRWEGIAPTLLANAYSRVAV